MLTITNTIYITQIPNQQPPMAPPPRPNQQARRAAEQAAEEEHERQRLTAIDAARERTERARLALRTPFSLPDRSTASSSASAGPTTMATTTTTTTTDAPTVNVNAYGPPRDQAGYNAELKKTLDKVAEELLRLFNRLIDEDLTLAQGIRSAIEGKIEQLRIQQARQITELATLSATMQPQTQGQSTAPHTSTVQFERAPMQAAPPLSAGRAFVNAPEPDSAFSHLSTMSRARQQDMSAESRTQGNKIPQKLVQYESGAHPANHIKQLTRQLQAENTQAALYPGALLSTVINDDVVATWVSERMTTRSIDLARQKTEHAAQMYVRSAPHSPFSALDSEATLVISPSHEQHAADLFRAFVAQFSTEDLIVNAQRAYRALQRRDFNSMREFLAKLEHLTQLLGMDLSNENTKRELVQQKLPRIIQNSLAMTMMSPATNTWTEIVAHSCRVDANLADGDTHTYDNDERDVSTTNNKRAREAATNNNTRPITSMSNSATREPYGANSAVTNFRPPIATTSTTTMPKTHGQSLRANPAGDFKAKAPCRTFARLGTCKFGDRCFNPHIVTTGSNNTMAQPQFGRDQVTTRAQALATRDQTEPKRPKPDGYHNAGFPGPNKE
jgi:hypothetical protein